MAQTTDASDPRAENARVAAAYDAVPYESPPDPALDPRHLLGMGALYGCRGSLGDVLELGCGTGIQLARAAGETSGRLVGVDLSRENCRRAEARLAEYGPRATIHNADFLDIESDSIGQFDIIYGVGTLYIVPPDVQRRLFSLIGTCLKPGGVAVLSYYSGTLPAARAYLHGLLRSTARAGLAPAEAIKEARETLALLARRLETLPPSLMLQGIRQSASLPDAVLYHEVFNPYFATLRSVDVAASLKPYGIDFLNRLDPGPYGGLGTAQRRAFEADAHDLVAGGYRYSLFGRPVDGDRTPDLKSADVVWRSSLMRTEDGQFRHQPSGQSLQIRAPLTAAILDHWAAQPCSLGEALTTAQRKLVSESRAARPEDEQAALGDVMNLWNGRLIWPLKS